MKQLGFLGYAKIVAGSALFAIGFRWFLYPNSIIPGGVTSISMIVNFLLDTPLGVLSLILNLPIFAIAWRFFGKKYLLVSLLGTVLCNLFIDSFGLLLDSVTYDPLLGAVFGGVIKGVGLGLIFSTGYCAGGTDIIAMLIRRKKPHINMGMLLSVVDAVIIFTGAVIMKNYEMAMYAAISVYLSSKLIDAIMYGLNYGKVAYVISSDPEKISRMIIDALQRGVTLLYGKGVYSDDNKNVIMCAIKRQEIVKLKTLVNSVDDKAFIIIVEAREVLGQGFMKMEN